MNKNLRKFIKLIQFAGLIATIALAIEKSEYILEAVNNIPSKISKLKETYLYDREFLDGSWSTNPEYTLNNKELELDKNQENIVLTLITDSDGSIDGEIISNKICDALPITWVISFESTPPDFGNLFLDRKFFIKQLHEADMETVSELELIDKDHKLQTIKFKTINDTTGSLPEFIVFGKNLPSYQRDFKEISEYCGESPRRLRETIKKNS